METKIVRDFEKKVVYVKSVHNGWGTNIEIHFDDLQNLIKAGCICDLKEMSEKKLIDAIEIIIKIMEENKIPDDGMVHDKNLPPRPRNFIFPFNPQLEDGYKEMLMTGKYFQKYEAIVKYLTLSGTTLQDREKVEMEYIKKDLDIVGQMYFQSYINFSTYFAAVYNLTHIFAIIRGNWELQHKQVVPDLPHGEEIIRDGQVATLTPPVRDEEKITEENMAGTTEKQIG
jgi:hypothetical protein